MNTVEFLAKWGLWIAGLIIVLVLFFQIRGDLFVEPEEDVNCALQILSSSRVVEMSGGKTSPEITCPTRNLDFEEANTQEELSKELATEMQWCWDTWGRGQYDLFSEDGTYCHICSSGTLPQSLDTFGEYLVTTTVPGLEQTYVDYFSAQSDETLLEEKQRLSSQQFSAELPIGETAVIYYHVRGDSNVEETIRQLRSGGSALTGFSIGTLGTGAAVAFATGCTLSGGVACAVILGGSALAGGAVSGVASYAIVDSLIANPPQKLAMITVKPLTEESIEELGCTYSYAKRR